MRSARASTVVEMGAGIIAAWIVHMIFADAGAWVVKVEPPEGDRLRTRRPTDSAYGIGARRAWLPTCGPLKASKRCESMPQGPTSCSHFRSPSVPRGGRVGGDALL